MGRLEELDLNPLRSDIEIQLEGGGGRSLLEEEHTQLIIAGAASWGGEEVVGLEGLRPADSLA